MLILQEVLQSRGLGRIVAPMEAASRKSVRLVAGEPSEDACTRLGGRPNLPPNMEWPTWREQPLAFVGQLDLSSLPKIQGVPLPAQGALSFFYEGGESAWGFDPDDKGSAVVLHIPQSLTELPRRNLPDDLDDHLHFKGVRLSPEPLEETVPGLEDGILEQFAMTPDEREAYFHFYEQWSDVKPSIIHRVGGYPDCVQGDPKLEAQLVSHGLYCGDTSGYKTGKERGLKPGAAEWELLLQVDSEEKSEMMWGDVGRIYFLIRRQDLQELRFDKTWVVFQCC